MAELTLFPCDQLPADCECLAHNGFLTRKGYERVDGAASSHYLDKVGSVSAVDPIRFNLEFDDVLLDEQFLRHSGGSF